MSLQTRNIPGLHRFSAKCWHFEDIDRLQLLYWNIKELSTETRKISSSIEQSDALERDKLRYKSNLQDWYSVLHPAVVSPKTQCLDSDQLSSQCVGRVLSQSSSRIGAITMFMMTRTQHAAQCERRDKAGKLQNQENESTTPSQPSDATHWEFGSEKEEGEQAHLHQSHYNHENVQAWGDVDLKTLREPEKHKESRMPCNQRTRRHSESESQWPLWSSRADRNCSHTERISVESPTLCSSRLRTFVKRQRARRCFTSGWRAPSTRFPHGGNSPSDLQRWPRNSAPGSDCVCDPYAVLLLSQCTDWPARGHMICQRLDSRSQPAPEPVVSTWGRVGLYRVDRWTPALCMRRSTGCSFRGHSCEREIVIFIMVNIVFLRKDSNK